MHLMVEPDGAGIFLSAPKRRKFRMVAVKITAPGDKARRGVLVLGSEIRVALRASAVAGAGQAQHAFVLHVAVRTGGRKGLLGMMDGSIVTCQAGLVGDGSLKSGGGNVACGAFVSDQGV